MARFISFVILVIKIWVINAGCGGAAGPDDRHALSMIFTWSVGDERGACIYSSFTE
jgi:hypothetical protein